MRIIEKANSKIAVLSLVGDPLGEPDAILLRKRITDISKDKINHVVIDLGAVKHINSAGLGGLIAAMFTMLRAGGTVTFTSPGNNVKEVLRITNLDKIFNIHPTVEEAVKQIHV